MAGSRGVGRVDGPDDRAVLDMVLAVWLVVDWEVRRWLSWQ